MEEENQVSAAEHPIAKPWKETDARALLRLRRADAQGRLPAEAARGPLGKASAEIGCDTGRLETRTIRRAYLAYLLNRTDRMLDALEQLNLLDVEYCPEIWRPRLMALVADLPFDHEPAFDRRFSPTTAIDIVFEIQEALLAWMSARPPEPDELLEAGA